MAAPVEFQDKYKVSIGLVVWFIAGAITATFSLTMIYNRFLSVESEMSILRNRIEYVDGRIDRKINDVESKLEEIKTDHIVVTN